MSSIKDQIVTLLKQRHHSHKVALEQEKDPRSKHAIDLIARIREDSQLIELIDSLPEETCKDSLQVPETCKENQDSFTSLEEAANDSWVLYEYRDTPQGLYSSCYRDGFIAGAEWQKGQMMEKAVEGVVCYGSKGAYVESDWLGTTDVEVYGDSGDKVKIVIIKDND